MNAADGSMFRRAVELLGAWSEQGKHILSEKKISEFRKIRLDIPDIFIIFVYRAIHNRRNSIGAHPAGAGYDS